MPIIGESKIIKEVLEKARKFAGSDHLLLITGATGTGKGLLAQEIHNMSARNNGPFVKVSVPNVPTELWDSEFFGHDKGAFTSALWEKHGYLEQANDGTLFLDEIGADLLPNLQAKLLPILEDKNFQKIGSRNSSFSSNARIIVATNADLLQMAREGRIRSDLYYRLKVLWINLPPLWEREGDLLLLANFFLKQYRQVPKQRFNRDSINFLFRQHWPGNIRQLENLIKSVCLLADERVIKKEILISQMDGDLAGNNSPAFGKLDFVIKNWIMEVLKKTGGNRSETARILGISRTSLLRRIDKFEIRKEEYYA